MAIKDFTISEDTEHQKPSEESNAASVKPIEKGESAQIKNAHAVGDGSYGRNDENGVEDKGKVEKEDNNY